MQHKQRALPYPRREVWRAKELLARSQKPVILTGAGISADSGVPTFRDADGLWNTTHWMRFSHSWVRKLAPARVFKAHEQLRALVDSCEPSAGHQALTTLCECKPGTRLFTQNVDGLHARSGTKAYELHGSLHRLSCRESCDATFDAPRSQTLLYSDADCSCGKKLQHDTVLFGDNVRFTDEFTACLHASDLVLLIGTSGTVTDTEGIAKFMHECGTPVIEVNPALFTPSSKYALHLRHQAEIILPNLL